MKEGSLMPRQACPGPVEALRINLLVYHGAVVPHVGCREGAVRRAQEVSRQRAADRAAVWPH